MKLHNRVRSLSAVVAASALLAFSSPAFSQDISDSHMKAARAAVAALHATDVFDNILPQAAAALEQILFGKIESWRERQVTRWNRHACDVLRASLEKFEEYAVVGSVQNTGVVSALENVPSTTERATLSTVTPC